MLEGLILGAHLQHSLEDVLADNDGLDEDDGEQSAQNRKQAPFVHAHLKLRRVLWSFVVWFCMFRRLVYRQIRTYLSLRRHNLALEDGRRLFVELQGRLLLHGNLRLGLVNLLEGVGDYQAGGGLSKSRYLVALCND